MYARLGGRKVAGLVAVGPGSKVAPMWSVYLASADADATARAAVEAGARALVAPMEISDQGRMAYFADPTGALFGVWQGRAHRGAEVTGEPGATVWHEVYTRDVGAARGFYGAVFGLEGRPLDAPGIEYWTLHRGDQVAFGAMQMTAQFPPEVPSHWNTYFAVTAVDASVDRLIALGGAVVAPAFDTPFGRLAFVADPFGAAFCLMAPTRLPGS
jgi:predicted enzyme related to lactoylglutathione lyase